jgi:hypothetical protein
MKLTGREMMQRIGMGIVTLMLGVSGLLSGETISGRVVSVSGQPVVSATVYVLRQDDKDFAASVWLDSYTRALGERLKETTKAGSSYEKALACRSELLAFHAAYQTAFDWATRMGEAKQIIAAITDETGNFSVDVPSGFYLVLAISKSGEAWWKTNASTKTGNTTAMLSVPVVACSSAK